MKKLTSEDRQRLKEEFFETKLGKWSKKHYKSIKDLVNILGLAPYAVLTIGTFIPYTWSVNIPYPISLILGHTYHGYTHYYGGNILDQLIYTRVASHHLLDLTLIWVSYYIMVFITKSFAYPALFSAYIIATHEYGWWIAYIIAHYILIFTQAQWELLYFSNKLTLIYALIIFFYIPIKGWNKKDFLYIGLICEYYAIWIATGFHVNWDFNGATPYEFDLGTVLTEIGSWVYSYMIFLSLVDWMKIKIRWF